VPQDVTGIREGAAVTALVPTTTGWEPHAPVADTLVRRFVFGHADRLARVARAAGGEIGSSDEALLADACSPRLMDNAMVLLQPPTPGLLDRVLRLARRFYPADRAWALVSAWPLPDLSWRDLSLVGHPRLMLRPAAPVTGPPAELRVARLDPSDSSAAAKVLTSVHPQLAGTRLLDVLREGSVVQLYVGHHEDRAVAVAGLAVTDELVEVDWLSTLPAVRRHGFGTSLLSALAGAHPGLPAALVESPLCGSVPGRAGFLPLLRITVWAAAPLTVPRARVSARAHDPA
jgi:hypothetical protein